MKFNIKGSFLSFQMLKKKNTDEVFYISKVLSDGDDVVDVFSQDEPVYSRGDIVELSINVNLQDKKIFSSFK